MGTAPTDPCPTFLIFAYSVAGSSLLTTALSRLMISVSFMVLIRRSATLVDASSVVGSFLPVCNGLIWFCGVEGAGAGGAGAGVLVYC